MYSDKRCSTSRQDKRSGKIPINSTGVLHLLEILWVTLTRPHSIETALKKLRIHRLPLHLKSLATTTKDFEQCQLSSCSVRVSRRDLRERTGVLGIRESSRNHDEIIIVYVAGARKEFGAGSDSDSKK